MTFISTRQTAAVTDERSQQINEGRSMANREKLTLNKKPQAKRSQQPKGHEAFLKALEASGAEVEFWLISEPLKIRGKVKTSDKFSVSIMETSADGVETACFPIVVYKHDISRFRPLQARQQEEV